jgi:hypothetical protein
VVIRCFYCVTLNATLLHNVPLGVVTTIVPVVAPAGTVVLIWEAEAVNVAGVPLKLTPVVAARLFPRIVTILPTGFDDGTALTNGPNPVATSKIVPSLLDPPLEVMP